MAFSGIPRTDLVVTPGRVELGLNVAIFGGTGGLGRALALRLTKEGADVTVIGRRFRDDSVRRLHFLEAELQSMREAQRVAAELPAEKIDVVIFTTGIMAAPERRQTVEWIEEDMAVSYLSRFAIVRALAHRLGRERANATTKPRIFVMGMPGSDPPVAPDDLNSERAYGSKTTHLSTVAANEALVTDGATRYPELLFFGLNPGLIKTSIRGNVLGGAGSLRHRVVEALIGVFTQAPDKYAERIAPLLVSPELEEHSGALLNGKGQPIQRSKTVTDDVVAQYMRSSDELLAKALASWEPNDS
jgi:NAD(P)-dependent dehydrogenase (short-subunit alcohol dehydrogenase family)